MARARSITVQSLWIGECLSQLERLSILSFLRNRHEYHLYVYRDVPNVPPGVIVEDANAILPESEVFTYRNGSYAAFSNWFRYRLIHATGWFWVDTDVVCLRPFEFEAERVFGYQEPSVVNTAVLRFPKDDPLMRTMEKLCRKPNTLMPYDDFRRMRRKLKRRFVRGNRRDDINWGEYGPVGLTALLKYRGLLSAAKPEKWFYPVHHSAWRSLFDGTFAGGLDSLRDSYCVHLWNEMLRRDGVDKNASFPKDSLIEQLKARYL